MHLNTKRMALVEGLKIKSFVSHHSAATPPGCQDSGPGGG